jgi:streptogrisin C
MGKRPVIIPTIAIAVVAVAAATIPAFADTSDQPTGAGGGLPATSADKAIVAPQTLAAMQRDLKLTADQARARVRYERWATRTDGSLRRSLGASYAGAWFDKSTRKMTVGVTTSAAADRVRAAGAEPKMVARSSAALDAAKSRLDRVAGRAAGAASGWFVEASTNSIVVVARPGKEAAAKAAVNGTGIARDAVRVVSSNESPRLLIDVRGGDAYFIDNQFRCSVGFSVEGGFVTAGHCGAVGASTSGPAEPGSNDQVAQGTVTASSFPGDDWGVVETNDDWTPTATVATTDQGVVPVAGSEEAPVGAAICRTGSTTGTRCGEVEAKNATVVYPEGTVTGLTRTNVCAEGGDSGGSWISGDQAQGVTSGGSGDCTVGGTTFFQPITEILERNNLTLVTNGNGDDEDPEEPEEPGQPEDPGVDCAGHENSVNGALGQDGARQVTSFFRANAGTHTACIAGPDGTDFDVALQRWNGRNWQTVADANNGTSADTLTFDGPAGTYRYQVRSQSGSGSYVLGVDIP